MYLSKHFKEKIVVKYFLRQVLLLQYWVCVLFLLFLKIQYSLHADVLRYAQKLSSRWHLENSSMFWLFWTHCESWEHHKWNFTTNQNYLFSQIPVQESQKCILCDMCIWRSVCVRVVLDFSSWLNKGSVCLNVSQLSVTILRCDHNTLCNTHCAISTSKLKLVEQQNTANFKMSASITVHRFPVGSIFQQKEAAVLCQWWRPPPPF